MSDDYGEFLRRRARLLGAAIETMGADAGPRADLTALQAEIDSLRAVQVTPGRVLGELNALLGERIAELKYWSRRLELEADAAVGDALGAAAGGCGDGPEGR